MWFFSIFIFATHLKLFHKLFSLFIINSKIIENEREEHNEKISFFLQEVIYSFIFGLLQNLKSKNLLNQTKKLLDVIIIKISEYELENLITFKLNNLSQQIVFFLSESEKKSQPRKSIFPKRKVSNKKIRFL